MGTGETVPGWVGEIAIMEQTGWTERELYEDVSLETILRMDYLNRMRGKARKAREQDDRLGAKGGTRKVYYGQMGEVQNQDAVQSSLEQTGD